MKLGLLLVIGLFACSGPPVDAQGRPVNLGKYRLRTYPKGAQVWVNDKLELETTPATLIKPPGEYRLRFQLPGAEPLERTVTVEAGEARELSLRIPSPPPAKLTVLSDIEGAEVRVNGYKRGETPLLGAVTTPGWVDITVVAGRHARSRKIQLKVGRHERLEIFFGAVQSQAEVEPPPVFMSEPPPTGKLTLGLKPDGWAETEDGKKLGNTPLVDYVLPAGTHTLRLQSLDGRYQRLVEVEIPADKAAVYRFRLSEPDQMPGWRADAGPKD